ncbi:hypothetical protein K469DRAFT_712862 [Zopfia rhizophila CBS 207.26]|uniref:Uncharacterized protein n=1 Tax=Zopfia rhizophila CBS 207.26 TaxID=1314779 RepID=A0A6A6DX39_9PEZI|nr:hypothetical protein K469DRAFT_712862 [Zopfia rhizophila CBS 207.26]
MYMLTEVKLQKVKAKELKLGELRREKVRLEGRELRAPRAEGNATQPSLAQAYTSTSPKHPLLPYLNTTPLPDLPSTMAQAPVSKDEINSLSIFPPEEESTLLSQSRASKTSANQKFSTGDFSSAIQVYETALSLCPNYLEYDIAVLRANIAACYLKLEEWKEAVESATLALEALERVDPPVKKDGKEEAESEGKVEAEEVDDVMELRLEALKRTGRTMQDVQTLRSKALLRRAKARREVGGWASLQGAQEDYALLSKSSDLTTVDHKTVQAALRDLPRELETAKNKEMTEMMGKLKQLGNGILKPFGLSTDNFNFVKDEKSGGYSMQFNQNG